MLANGGQKEESRGGCAHGVVRRLGGGEMWEGRRGELRCEGDHDVGLVSEWL